MIIVDKAEKTTINISKNSLGNTSFKDYATQQWVKSNYYDKEEVDELIDNVEVDLSNYYTIEQVDELIDNVSFSYAVFDYNENDVVEIVNGNISKVIEDYKQHKPVLVFVPIDNQGKMGVVNCFQLLTEDMGYDKEYLVGYVNLFTGDSITFRRYTFSHTSSHGYSNATKSFNDYYTKTESDAKYLTKGVGATIEYVDGEIENVKNIIEENELVTAAALTELKQDIPTNISQLTNDSNYATQTWVENNFTSNDKFEELTDLVNDVNTDISTLYDVKQDTLVSGENIKTINGNSLLGGGDIIVEGGGSSIVELTQAEYDALGDNVDADTLYLISDATISANYKTINGESILGEGNIEISGGGTTDLSNYYTKTESDNKFQEKGNYLTSIPSEYVTESELTAKNYATKSEIPTIPTNVSSFTNDAGYITNTALDGYATETYVSDTYQVKGDYLTSVPDEYVTDTELTNKGYATTTYVDTQIGNINTILENIIG